jgi:hypothetical protein
MGPAITAVLIVAGRNARLRRQLDAVSRINEQWLTDYLARIGNTEGTK